MEVRIRKMAYGDVSEACRIEKDSFSGEAWGRESFEYSINSEHDYAIAAECDGGLAGYAVMRISIDAADIVKIAVDKECRRKGIGFRLMKKLLEHGYSTGVRRYAIEVRSHNSAAIDLYERFGFEIYWAREKYYSNPVDHGLVMLMGDVYDTPR